jgi:hypothetical protein
VATKDLYRIGSFINRLSEKFYIDGGKLAIVITDSYNGDWFPLMSDIENFNKESQRIFVTICDQKPRLYGSVMKLKVEACEEIAAEDTCVFMADDDYVFNQNCFEYASNIFDQYSHVDYLSFTKGPGVIRDEQRVEKLLGLDFQRLISTLGGAVIVRWNVYKEHMNEYFIQNNVTGDNAGSSGMYDWHYFDSYLSIKYNGRKDNVYTIWNPSLMQHCNMGSHFVKSRRGPLDHMYAENFDPLFDPLKMGELEMLYTES